MGCDIHLFVERFDGAKWISCDEWVTEEGDTEPHVPYKQSFYHDRNYDLFSIFADVRNGRGFAGCPTGDGFVPIAEPRGIPDDCCEEYRRTAEAYGGDGHSHSWLTVADITAYDWTQVTSKQGVVKPSEWAQWKLNGEPRGWCGSIAGRGIITVSNEEMERAAVEVTGGKLWDLYHDQADDGAISKAIYEKLGGKEKYGAAVTSVRWEIPYYRTGHQFLATVLPRLWRLGKPEDVRIAFFFDN